MKFRHLSMPRVRQSVLLSAMLFATAFSTQAAQEMLRKPVGMGAYEMAYSQSENALFVATSQSRSLDKGGVVYRLDPTTLDVTQRIHNDIKPFGAVINTKTNTLWFGNSVDGMVTALDARTSDVKGRVVLDPRPRSETVKPFQPRQLAVDEATNTVYVTGVGKESVIWVVDGNSMTLKTTIADTGARSTALALDAANKRLYTANADGELIAVDTATNRILSRKKLLDDGKEHFFINLSLDTANQRAYVTDSKQPKVLVVDLKKGEVAAQIDAPESLAVLFNPVRNEVYVTHRQAGEVSIIDAKTNKVTKTIKTPVHPNSLALSADGQTLYVSVKQASSRQNPATSPDDVIRIAL